MPSISVAKAMCGAVLAAVIVTPVAAQSTEPVSPASDFSFSANMTLASQYRYRGLMQTNNKPAIQGGFDLSHSSGLYIGNWNSSISWLGDSDDNVSAPLEMDFYAGYTAPIWGDLTIDVGVLQYYYPGSYPRGFVSPDTTELYLGLGYGPVSFKYSHAVTNLFGWADSKNSQYYDLSASVPTGFWGLNVDGHVGYQRVRNLADGNYTDWSLGLSKTWGNVTASLAYVDTNADKGVYTSAATGRYQGKAAAVFSLTAAF
ncbi:MULTISPECIES: TorF family putative porin [unclassified Pusillimonas]|uniref:TorF family putative porin n=1 Tax=unclassified Pusillimonas TaxID=2640016 RepID=UPI001F3B3140|nr:MULTISPECIES: TorF family putative porin [unclassified Pusillimonas]